MNNTDLFGNQILLKNQRVKGQRINPMITYYGAGSPDIKCGGCAFHYFKTLANKYPKCSKRKCTSSPSTDHSSQFPVCSLYEPKN
ncbi:hypothetical protein [Emticicia sp. 17c]|uniref:hypothetical protein n=1 Tax=Emticicia sp. 17c TaxID=3127704 RepID=UPI00301CD460